MAKKPKRDIYILPQKKVIEENGKIYEMYGTEIIDRKNAAHEARVYSCLFGANKNLYRVIPSLQDGMKPSMRRLFWSWWTSDGKPQNTRPETIRKLKFYKGGILSTHSMEYHPHSDSGISDMIGRLGQTFSNNVMYIVPQGSFGNLERAEAASGRYITARLSEFTIDCFFSDFDKYCVPLVPAYDGDKFEPSYLPAKYPTILFNAQFSSIGYGAASNIPPFNPKEVMEATIKLIENPKAKILLIPDAPTGADIIDSGNFKQINDYGFGQVTMQATSEIDYVNNTITLTSIPITVKTNDVLQRVLRMQKEKHLFDEIIHVKNETKRGDVYLQFSLKPNANPDKVLENLYKKDTGLRKTFPVGIVVIDDFEKREYGIKALLLDWIDYRRDTVRAMLLKSLQQVMEKQHMNAVLLMVFSKENIDDAVKIAKNSGSRKETIEKYMRRFRITSLQAATIADMHVYNFNKDSYDRYKEEKKKLKEEVDRINYILDKEKHLDQYIIDELKEGIQKYGSPRRSKIIRISDKLEDVPNVDYLVGITQSGYIKKIPLKKNESIGFIGKEPSPITVLKINNRENLLLVDGKGNICKVPISSIPDMSFEDNGLELQKFFKVSSNIKAVLQLPNNKSLDTNKEFCILFITKNGVGKRVLLSEFKKITGVKSGITLENGDEVANALFTMNDSSKDIIISTNLGNGIRLSINDIKIYGPMAKGLPFTILSEGEYITKASKILPKAEYIVYMTKEGKSKLTEMKYFPKMKRLDKPMPLINISSRDSLIGISSVSKKDSLLVYRQHDGPYLLSVEDVPLKARLSKGESVVPLEKKNSVVDFTIYVKT